MVRTADEWDQAQAERDRALQAKAKAHEYQQEQHHVAKAKVAKATADYNAAMGRCSQISDARLWIEQHQDLFDLLNSNE